MVATPTHLPGGAANAALMLASAGLARAFGDVEIRPGAGKKFLTIPLVAQAYGRRADTRGVVDSPALEIHRGRA